MENLKFEPKHNLVACLDESIPETEGYRDMIRFIKRTKYVYAMCAKPVIYARLIKSFWRTAEVIRDDNGVAVVRGNITRELMLTVSEEAIRTALRIDDDEVGMNDELTMAECQSCFVNMGHPPAFPKSQFYRAKLGKKWKLLCYVVQQCMSRRSAGFDNFPSDIASPIVAIAENKPFNMSRWIMNGFVFNLVKGKRFKFLMYPRFLQLMINVAYPMIREEGVVGGILYTEDMNDLSYRKMSIRDVPSMDLFDYMRDIANNEEDVEGIYHHISHGEIVNPQDLVDEVPDNLLDDDEYFARHPEDENESENEEEDDSDDGENDDNDSDSEESDDSGDDGENDGGDNAESDSEEAEIIKTAETMDLGTENVGVVEQSMIEEPVEVASVEEEVVSEVPKIAQEVMAEAETIAQIVDEADAGVTDPILVDIPTTSSQVAEKIEQVLESSPKVVSSVDETENEKKIAELEEMVTKLVEANELLKASNERKKKRFEEFWDIHNQNLKTFKELDADHLKLKIEHDELKDKYDRLKEEHENLKYDYKELKAECNTLEDEKEMLEKWLEETKPKKSGSTSDKDFSDEVVEMTEATQVSKVYLTRARGTTNVGIRVDSPIIIPDEAVAETVNTDKAEGKRKLDAVPEITGDEGCSKKAKLDETVQIEPIQSVAVVEMAEIAKDVEENVTNAEVDKSVQIEPIQSETVEVEEVPKTVTVEASQFEPVQTDNAPMIEALDDLDDIDFTESEPEAEPETNVDQEIPDDLDQRFAYLEKMKYNAVFLNGLTVSQINEEYEKCMIAQDKAEADEKEFIIEMGEWTPLQESLNIEDLPPTELYHQNPEEMSSREMRDWLSSRNYPYRTLKRLKSESLRKIVVSFMKTEKMYNRMFYLDYNNPQYYELTKRYKILGPKELPVMALPENAHKKRQELMDMFPSEVKSYNIPMDIRESWHKSATAGDVVRSLLSKGQSIAELLDSMIVPEKNKKVKIIAWKYDEVFDAFMIKRVNGLCDVYHYYSSIFKLEVQDLKELHKLRLINHTHAERGDKCAMLLDAGIARSPKYLDFRGQQEDSAYVQAKKERKKKRLIVSEDMYLEEFSDEYFDKVTNPGLKVIDGSQMTKPILRVFNNQENFELKLVRNLEDWDKGMITLFSTFELKLLHPSYIDFLRSCRMEKCKDKLAEADRKLFVVMIKVIAAAFEKIRVRKALLNSNLVRVDIPEIEFMRISAKGTLEVQVKGQEMPFEFYANIYFAGLNLDSLRRMNACPILTNESKPRQAKIAEKFKSCIEEALKEQEEFKGKELLDIKEEPEDCSSSSDNLLNNSNSSNFKQSVLNNDSDVYVVNDVHDDYASFVKSNDVLPQNFFEKFFSTPIPTFVPIRISKPVETNCSTLNHTHVTGNEASTSKGKTKEMYVSFTDSDSNISECDEEIFIDSTPTVIQGKKSFKSRCFRCGKETHVVKNYPELARKSVNNSRFTNRFNRKPINSFWHVDSGCSQHITGLKDLLTNFRIINSGYVAFAGDKKGGKMIGQGDVTNGSLTLEKVNYVPELHFNLLSVSKIYDKDIPVLFKSDECLFLKPDFSIPEDLIVMRAPRKNDMYLLDMNSKESTSTITCLLSKASSSESFLWHRKLGHVNFDNINKFVKHNLVCGLPLKDFSVAEKCMACAKGKQQKKSHKLKLINSISSSFELLHADLFRPISVKSIAKKSYCLVVTDDFSRYSWRNIKAIQCSKNSTTECVAERKNRTLVEAARTMLIESKLPIIFWAEAVNCASYVLNRMLIVKDKMKTSYELFHKRKPLIYFFRPFDCSCTLLNTQAQTSKVGVVSDECFFVGYSSSQKAYRVYNKRTIIVQESFYVDWQESNVCNTGSNPAWFYDATTVFNSFNLPLFLEEEDIILVHFEAPTDPIITILVQEIPQPPPSTPVLSITPNSSSSPSNPAQPLISPLDSSAADVTHDSSTLPQSDISTLNSCYKEQKNHPHDLVIGSISDEETKSMELVDLPPNKYPIGTKWVYKNKPDDRGVIIRNKARLVVQGFVQEERIDYTDVFARVARI
ncbi:hypothetical protein QVD17_41920 [Tagetes erecta]|uniref:Uncharacterized protein n=1 Tax=Tagetes erecta TaxID=13708 RepID=A0AAD8JL83_TARER|nr:hypothetical protein QVD17_41920 [Tagetes erecta]